jgi:pimeloyl-ACP methyl ester carboxylesterase
MHPSASAIVVLFAAVVARAQDIPDCHIGSYRLTNGTLVDIAPESGDTLRWSQFDGETGELHKIAKGDWASTRGWTDSSDGKTVAFSDCHAGGIRFDGVPGRRIAFDVTNTTFEGHDVTLAGRLVMPKGDGKVPIVVMVHGSEQTSALTSFFLQRMLPAEGVGAFVYDKRGTGQSGGKYTQDYSLLADDAVAAMREAKRLAAARVGRIGYQGGSQAGWVEPIAANRAPVDFVIVCYGLAVNVIDEDQEAVELQMRERGYSADDIAAGLSVARAAENVFESGFTRGFAQFDSVRAKYRGALWYKNLRGDYTWFLLPHSEKELRAMAPQFDWGVPFRYDPMPALRAGTVPQLWILGGEDDEAPSAETRKRLQSLIDDGRPFTVAYYPHAEHGMTLFETGADGERTSTRYAPGYFKMLRDFAVNGRLQGSYGDAEVAATRHPGR